MSILKIIEYGNPILRQESKEVIKISKKIKTLINDMLETMYLDKGCGLAAPQVGISKRIVVIDPNPSDEDLSARQPMYLVNPEIIWRSDEMISFNEGCLSLPDQRADVERHERIRVRYLDYNGKEQELLADDILSIILQHEIDHLDGILYIDRISRLKRSRLLKKLEKFQEDRAKRKDK